MKKVYADTSYWIAITNPKDNFHNHAKTVSRDLQDVRLVTSEWVLSEFLNYFAARGDDLRDAAVKIVNAIRFDPNIDLVPATRNDFLTGLDFYTSRMNKGYSHVDCISMSQIQKKKIIDVLTYDNHFLQEGLVTLRQ